MMEWAEKPPHENADWILSPRSQRSLEDGARLFKAPHWPGKEGLSKLARPRNQDIIFSFGPKDAFFISASLGGYHYSGPNQISQAFMINRDGAIYAAALTRDHGFITVYRERKDGPVEVTLSTKSGLVATEEAEAYVERQKQYRRLYEFLRADKGSESRRKATFTIGAGPSWFAKRGETIAYNALPKALLMELHQYRENKVRPVQVALGMRGSYVAVWSDRTWTWELDGYEGLGIYLREGVIPNTITLSPYNNKEWFLAQDDGHVLWKLLGPKAQKGDVIQREALRFMQAKAKDLNRAYKVTMGGELARNRSFRTRVNEC
jgi:hypothetical protein